MKRLIPMFLIFLVSCGDSGVSGYQYFPEYDFSIQCPCNLLRDTVTENLINIKTGNNAHSLYCVDSTSLDEYRMNVLLEYSQGYTPRQVIDEIDSTLTTMGIKHEGRRVGNEEAVVIDYGNAMEVEILTNNLSYYFVLMAKDSLKMKFERTIETIQLK